MSNISPEQVILTLPDPRSVGSNPNELDIPIVRTGSLFVTASTLTPGIVDVLVRDTVTGAITTNNTFVAGGGVTTITAVGAAPNTAGGTIALPNLTLQPADATRPGLILPTAQTIGGDKTFSGAVTTGTLTITTAANTPAETVALVRNTVTGAITTNSSFSVGAVTSVAAVGAVPNAGGASIAGSVLTLQPATGALPGVLTAIAQTIGGNKTFSGAVTAGTLTITTAASTPAETVVLVRNAGTGAITTNSGFSTAAATSLGPVGISPNANGATLIANVLALQPTNGALPGVLSTTTQTIGGNKIFSNTVTAGSLIITTAADTPAETTVLVRNAGTGAITTNTLFASSVTSLTAVGAVPNANGGTIAANALTLQPASATFPGVTTAIAQTFGGVKTFAADITAQANISLPTTTPTTGAAGVILVNGIRFISSAATDNTFIGSGSGNFTLTGAGNTAIGRVAAPALTIGGSNVVIGNTSGSVLSTGSFNTIVGQGSGTGITGAMSNTIIGQDSCTAALTGALNTVVGKSSGTVVTTASQSTIIGAGSGTGITTGQFNTVLGAGSGNGITTKFNAVIVGQGSGGVTDTGDNTTIVGQAACSGGITGINNTIIGRGTCTGAFTGASNTVVGSGATAALTSGTLNTISGNAAANALTSGSSNVIIGQLAAPSLTTGGSNVIIGRNAGTVITTGSNNIYISANASAAAEANTTRIGSAQTSTYIAGVASHTPTVNYNLVSIDNVFSDRIGSIDAVMDQPLFIGVTMTPNVAGPITNITIRGVALVTDNYDAFYTRIGKLMMVTFPAFTVTAGGNGSSTLTLLSAIPAGLRPQFTTTQSTPVVESGVVQDNAFYVQILTTGTVQFASPTGVVYNVPYGIVGDITVCYALA